jgi:adenylosuccinate lyase
MRKYGMAEPYEQLKAVTRGRRLDAGLFLEILEELKLPEAAQAELRDLRPDTYIGIAANLATREFN